jgi:hypothetical protein
VTESVQVVEQLRAQLASRARKTEAGLAAIEAERQHLLTG